MVDVLPMVVALSEKVDNLTKLVSALVVKPAYTLEEVHKRTEYSEWYLAQACSHGAIQTAYKASDGAWRIPHATVEEILANGIPRFVRRPVKAPRKKVANHNGINSNLPLVGV